jgi:hypothetical protein
MLSCTRPWDQSIPNPKKEEEEEEETSGLQCCHRQVDFMEYCEKTDTLALDGKMLSYTR